MVASSSRARSRPSWPGEVPSPRCTEPRSYGRKIRLSSRKRIVVLHLAGRYPLGGIGWQALHYVLGLSRLGHDVYYVEDSGAHPYDPRVKSVVADCSYGVAFLADVMSRFDLADRWSYVERG